MKSRICNQIRGGRRAAAMASPATRADRTRERIISVRFVLRQGATGTAARSGTISLEAASRPRSRYLLRTWLLIERRSTMAAAVSASSPNRPGRS
jgi:hypothetical protein